MSSDDSAAEITSDHQEKMTWMKNNSQPSHIVKEYMAATIDLRKMWVNDEEHSLPDILTEFPRILDPLMVSDYLFCGTDVVLSIFISSYKHDIYMIHLFFLRSKVKHEVNKERTLV